MQITQLEEQLISIKEQNERLRELNAELEARNITLRETLETKSHQRDENGGTLLTKTSHNNGNNMVDTTTSLEQQQLQPLTRLSQRITNVNTRLNTIRESCDSLTEKSYEFHTWSLETINTIQQIQQTRESVQHEIQRLGIRNDELGKLVSEHDRQLRNVQFERDTVQTRLERIQNELVEEQRAKSALIQELETFKTHVIVHLEPLIVSSRVVPQQETPPNVALKDVLVVLPSPKKNQQQE
jgi:DNA repair exonuclease SbcCD ATPase subunit